MNRLRLGVGLLAASTAIISFVPVQNATADPLISKALVGVGSDTTQDIHNAFAGAAPFTVPFGQGGTKKYDPLFSSPATGNVPTVSWDAQDPLGSVCIIPKLGAGQIDRPNGSTDGVKALSKAAQGLRWDAGKGCSPAAATNNVSGQIDFARSSSGANPGKFPGTQLTFIPFARDGLGYAYVDKDNSGTFTGGLSTDTLKSGYGAGNGVASPTGTFLGNDGQTVRVCGIQIGSGTNKSWDKAMGHTLADGVKSNESARNSGCGDTYQEHNGDAWFNSPFVTGLAATENVIIPFSGAQWISQGNQTALDNSVALRAGGDMGEIILSATGVNIGNPYNGTAPTMTPDATFYANSTFGRDVNIVVPTAKVPAVGGDAVLKSLFRGATSAVCSANASTVKTAFGFAAPAVACGTTGAAQQQGYIN